MFVKQSCFVCWERRICKQGLSVLGLSRRASSFTWGPAQHAELTNHAPGPKPLLISPQRPQNETKIRIAKKREVLSPWLRWHVVSKTGITPPPQRTQTSTIKSQKPPMLQKAESELPPQLAPASLYLLSLRTRNRKTGCSYISCQKTY